MSTFGERIRSLRIEHGLTGTELGKIFNLTRSGISSYEARGSFTDEATLKKIAAYFDVSIDYLIGASDVKNPFVELEVDEEVHSFTVELVKQLMKSGIIADPDNIPIEITDMIVAALKNDIKTNKKGTKQ